jgi:glycosyltransferase involved in cell wall biosynthesis
MKNIWILNHYAQEPGGSGGTRHYHLAENLVNQGWSSTIIAASVDHVSGRQRLGYGPDKKLVEINGIPFLWVKTPKYTGNGGGRILNMLAFTCRVLRPKTTNNLNKPDVVLGSSVHPFAAVAAALLAKRFGVPFIFEVRDLWPQTLIDMGRLRDGSFIVWILQWLEKWLYRRADKIIVLLPFAWKYIVPLGFPKDKILCIPNGVDLKIFPRSTQVRAKEQDKFILMYFGSHGQANGLENLIDAMSLVEKMEGGSIIQLRLIGDGPLKEKLINKVEKMGLTNIFFDKLVPKNEIPSIAALADAFVIPIPNLPNLYQYGVSPNKLFDYLAACRPIIIATCSANNPVEEAGAGYSVPPDQPRALADAIVCLSQLSVAERQEMGQNGFNYVNKNHDFVQLSARLAALLDDTCSEKLRR